MIPTSAVEVRGSDLFDFNIALQGRIPIKKWEPYGVFGMAVLMNPYTAGILTPSGAVAYVGQRHSKFGLEWGAGCRYYARHDWGIRTEYRYTSSTRNFNRVTGRHLLPIRLPAIQSSSGFCPAFEEMTGAHRAAAARPTA